MSMVPAGKRNWKCPECGSDVLLSVTQLDPLACEACLHKMKGDGSSTGVPSIASVTAGPLGIWSSLPETTKLGIVVAALVGGLVVGYLAGSKTPPPPPAVHHTSSRSKESAPVEETPTHEDSTAEPEAEVRPEPPGPGYKWVRGRKHKDGTYGSGHWAKDPRADESKSSK